MPIAAGVVSHPLVTALITLFHVAAQHRRAAVLNRTQHLPLRGGPAVPRQVLVSMLPHHIGYFEPMSGHVSCCALPLVLAL